MNTNLENVAPATDRGHAGRLQWLVSIESAAGTAIEYIAALLVVAEIVVLFAGVVSRYVFHQPILWSDELASTLFLWLAMLGAVVALRRDEHMRMTAIVGIGVAAGASVSGCARGRRRACLFAAHRLSGIRIRSR